jgi:hypothetical protein
VKPSQIAAARLEQRLLRRLGRPVPAEVAHMAALNPDDFRQASSFEVAKEQTAATAKSGDEAASVSTPRSPEAEIERKEQIIYELLAGKNVSPTPSPMGAFRRQRLIPEQGLDFKFRPGPPKGGSAPVGVSLSEEEMQHVATQLANHFHDLTAGAVIFTTADEENGGGTTSRRPSNNSSTWGPDVIDDKA